MKHISPEVKEVIRSATAKMNMDPNTTFVGLWLSVTGSPASAHNRTIWIDPKLFALFAPDELEAVIGHECSHIIHRDTPFTRSLANLAAPVISYALLKGYEFTANTLLDRMKIKFSTGNDGVSTIINGLKAFNNILGFHFLPRYLLNLYLLSRFTQHQEARSDIESALKLKSPGGMINFFNKFKSAQITEQREEIAKEVSKVVVQEIGWFDPIYIRS